MRQVGEESAEEKLKLISWKELREEK